MTVYVDNALVPERHGRSTGRWSHIFADSAEELEDFRARLRIQERSWGTVRTAGYILVTETWRYLAISIGAVPVSEAKFILWPDNP